MVKRSDQKDGRPRSVVEHDGRKLAGRDARSGQFLERSLLAPKGGEMREIVKHSGRVTLRGTNALDLLVLKTAHPIPEAVDIDAFIDELLITDKIILDHLAK